eukprot:CAMPEP_0176430166 /NCGR_PEP_ID=MMETSP0127-20121128/14101_1 /TAXON_ID=938130 /ORGANISM="Platyophrya macrostoma, Strain WH" /LENGTH=223 /DNA_ID=CAMNT_0017812023 /DNA_START=29 /DNA_END=700 /DNA_ORIENTATION=-
MTENTTFNNQNNGYYQQFNNPAHQQYPQQYIAQPGYQQPTNYQNTGYYNPNQMYVQPQSQYGNYPQETEKTEVDLSGYKGCNVIFWATILWEIFGLIYWFIILIKYGVFGLFDLLQLGAMLTAAITSGNLIKAFKSKEAKPFYNGMIIFVVLAKFELFFWILMIWLVNGVYGSYLPFFFHAFVTVHLLVYPVLFLICYKLNNLLKTPPQISQVSPQHAVLMVN